MAPFVRTRLEAYYRRLPSGLAGYEQTKSPASEHENALRVRDKDNPPRGGRMEALGRLLQVKYDCCARCCPRVVRRLLSCIVSGVYARADKYP